MGSRPVLIERVTGTVLIEAAKALLDYGLKLLKQSGDEEAVADLQAALGKAVADASERPKSVRDLQREAAAKLGVSSQ